MSYWEMLESIETMINKLDGSFGIQYSQACGWYTHCEVFGEPDKIYVSKDYHDKADAIECLYSYLLTL